VPGPQTILLQLFLKILYLWIQPNLRNSKQKAGETETESGKLLDVDSTWSTEAVY